MWCHLNVQKMRQSSLTWNSDISISFLAKICTVAAKTGAACQVPSIHPFFYPALGVTGAYPSYLRAKEGYNLDKSPVLRRANAERPTSRLTFTLTDSVELSVHLMGMSCGTCRRHTENKETLERKTQGLESDPQPSCCEGTVLTQCRPFQVAVACKLSWYTCESHMNTGPVWAD